MTSFYCRLIYTVFSVALCAVVSSTGAQPGFKMVSPQKGSVQKKSAADSILSYKIDSQLLQALAQQQKGVENNIETLEPVNVGADTIGNLSVDISATITDSLLHTITSLGGTIIYPSKEYHTVRAIINLLVVKRIALRPDVTFIRPAVLAQTNAPRL